MKKIKNPWLGHTLYNCFGCAPNNPSGLQMEFYEDGDDIVSIWKPRPDFQGWIETMHGGILSTIIDEICGWVVFRKAQTSGFTTQLNVKYRKSISTNEPHLKVRAHITQQKRNLLFIHAEIRNSEGTLCVEGDATYFLVSKEKATQMGFSTCKTEEEDSFTPS